MFRYRSTANNTGVMRASSGLLIAIVVATGLNIWLTVEIRKEQRAVAEILRGGFEADIQRLGSLPAELSWQLVFSIVVLLVLVVSAGILLFVVRAYLASQTTLRDTVTLARDILRSIDYGVITVDTQGLVTSVNPQACQLLAIEAKSLGRPLRDIDPLGALLDEICREVLASGESTHDRAVAIEREDGHREMQVDCHTLCGTGRDRQGVVLNVRDVTQQALLQQRMRRMERFLGLGTLAAGLHHEIKNPLSALSLHVQLLEEGLSDRLEERQLEHLNVLKTEVTRIAGVLESFRDYASLEQLNLTPLAVQDIVQQTVGLIGPQARQQGVSVDWSAESTNLPFVMADAVRLEQVLLNLALNALEAMRQGGQLSFSVRCDDNQVVISVADTGPGIPESVQGFVLDPYFTTKSGGSGMGLAFCDKIARQHGGQLNFDTGSQGTAFHLTLPAVNEHE